MRKHAPTPRYPENQRWLQNTGALVVVTIIGEDGKAVCPRIDFTELEPPMSYVILAKMLEWRFEPARRDGQPVSVYYNLTVNFALR